jgi:hypothetical protein
VQALPQSGSDRRQSARRQEDRPRASRSEGSVRARREYPDSSYSHSSSTLFVSIYPNMLQVSTSLSRTVHILTHELGCLLHQACGVFALSAFGIPRSSSGSQSATPTRALGLLQDRDYLSWLITTRCMFLGSEYSPSSMVLMLRTRVRCIELLLSGHTATIDHYCLWG